MIEQRRALEGKVVELEPFTQSNEANSTSESEVDLSFYINDVCAGDNAQLAEIITTLKESMIESIDALVEAAETKDIDSIKLHTHTMKGIASSLNANKMLNKSEQIFQMTSQGQVPDLSMLQELINLLKVNSDQTSLLLKQYLVLTRIKIQRLCNLRCHEQNMIP